MSIPLLSDPLDPLSPGPFVLWFIGLIGGAVLMLLILLLQHLLRARRRPAMSQVRQLLSHPSDRPFDPEVPVSTLPAYLGGLVLAVTTVGGKAEQQDAAYALDLPGSKIVIVADGVSSAPRAERAARLAVLSVLEALWRRALSGRPITLETLEQAFQRAYEHLRRLSPAPPGTPGPQTTLIVAVELSDRFLVAYCGDGGAYLTTGSLRWCNNVLFPQQDFRQAGALTDVLGGSSPPRPNVLSFRKGWPDGGILAIGTDGALPLGGSLSAVQELLQQVREAVRAGQSPDWVVEEWLRRRPSEDNRSLGLLISEEALRTWRGDGLLDLIRSSGERPKPPPDPGGAPGGGGPGGAL